MNSRLPDASEPPMSHIQLLADLERWPADWRKDWEIKEHSRPMPQAWHRSGLCFFFEFEQLDEEGNWGWVVGEDDISISRLEELKLDMGVEAFNGLWTQLSRQAKVRWHELGYNDWSLRKHG
jgi:hypothetical protein